MIMPQIKARKEKVNWKRKETRKQEQLGHTIQNKTTQVGKKQNDI